MDIASLIKSIQLFKKISHNGEEISAKAKIIPGAYELVEQKEVPFVKPVL